MSTLSTNNFTELATGDTVPAKYLVHGSAKAWANLNGTGTITLRDSLNVSGVVDNGTANYEFSLTSAMQNANYSIPTSSSRDADGTDLGRCNCEPVNLLTTGFDLRTGVFSTANVLEDHTLVNASVFGDLA